MPLQPRRRLYGLLIGGMAAATLPAPVLGVLATFIIDDLAIGRGELGLALTMNVLVAAVLSPVVGRLTDRIGGRLGLLSVFSSAAAGLALIAGAGVYPWLLAGAGVAAIGQAFGNPSTNKLIAAAVAPGRRGYITGLKQSGVQVGVFIAGLALPAAAGAYGWRTTLWVIASLAVAGGAVTWTLADDRSAEPRRTGPRARYPAAITWLALYGALLGFGGAVTFFFALFVEEALGGSPEQGGAVVAASGFAAMIGRVALARLAERRNAFASTLAAIAGAGVVSIGLIAASTSFEWFVWPGAVLFGLSVLSWNSVGMLAVISETGALGAGGASGIVMLGFFGGLGVAPPLYGRSVDVTGDYATMWWLSAAVFAIAVATIAVWHRPARAAAVPDSPR